MLRIRAQHLSKRFRRKAGSSNRRWRPWWRPAATGGEPDAFWALRDVSLEVRTGEMIGVIGHNGAGKSTLLNLLGGIGSPTTGSVTTSGRIGALLDLGGGFVGDLTGRENVMLAGVVAGLTRQEVKMRFDEMVAFAEMERFIDEPVRTYSTGMGMRLAFSVAVHTDPDILLVDEFLSVGDLAFQTKCRGRIRQLRDAGCAIVFVTHGIDQVRDICDRALWLRRGEVAAFDRPEIVTELYEEEMREETLRRTPEVPAQKTESGRALAPKQNRFGSLEAEITRVVLRPGATLRPGDPLEVDVHYRSQHPINEAVFVVSISGDDGEVYVDQNTQSARVPVPTLEGEGHVRLRIERLDLSPGNYFVNAGIFESKWQHAYDFHWHVYPLTFDGPSGQKALLAPPCRWLVDDPVPSPPKRRPTSLSPAR